MLSYFALESQTQKPLRSIILNKIILLMFCISTCHVGLWMSQIRFFTSMDSKREIIYFQYNIEIYKFVSSIVSSQHQTGRYD